MKNIYKSDSRGKANLGWLKSFHTFSFGEYYNPDRMGFGKLRVFNDDEVDPSQGFGTHPHKDMEIISFPISGSLLHKDSQGNEQFIHKGEVQIMSAGTGVFHSEYNASETEKAHFLQIWILPKELQISPRYQQKKFEFIENEWTLLVSPDGKRNSLVMNQDAHISYLKVNHSKHSIQLLAKNVDIKRGQFLFVIHGSIIYQGDMFAQGDAVGLIDESDLDFHSQGISELLLIEVPL